MFMNMEFYTIAVSIVLFVLLIPYIRFVIIRIGAEMKIKRSCKENGYSFHAAHPFPFLFPNNTGCVDFYVRSDEKRKVYCVKLFGSLRKRQTLYFIDGDKYQFVDESDRLVNLPVMPVFKWTRDTPLRKLRPIDYTAGLGDSAYTLHCIPVIMVCPVSFYVKRARTEMQINDTTMRPSYLFEKHKPIEYKAKGVNVYEGDAIHDAYLFTSSSFVRELYCSCLNDI